MRHVSIRVSLTNNHHLSFTPSHTLPLPPICLSLSLSPSLLAAPAHPPLLSQGNHSTIGTSLKSSDHERRAFLVGPEALVRVSGAKEGSGQRRDV